MSRSQKQRRKKSRSPARKRAVTCSFSQVDALAQEAGPSHASGSGTVSSGAPPGYPTFEMQTMDDAPFSPQAGPSSSLSYGQQTADASSPATMSELTLLSPSHNEAGPSSLTTYPAIQTRAQKAAQSASLPKLKRQVSNEARQRRAEKAQRKRDRDVEDRVNLNSVLPEDRRCYANPPGLVEVIKRATIYIPEVQCALQGAHQRIEQLERSLDSEVCTNKAVGIILSTLHTDDSQDADGTEGLNEKVIASNHILYLQEEIRQLRAQIPGNHHVADSIEQSNSI
ncbi:hypothetical protein DENSPDRAFT_297226 [Dentipellis sp. KUC8613]|nr:hypothetical protein DENSPDRAFT_297226 [Dentipellis sp. KUC8613]